jgi:hypothetical protein
MQVEKHINAVILQRCINLFLSTHDKDFSTFTAQNTTEKKVLIRTHVTTALHELCTYF